MVTLLVGGASLPSTSWAVRCTGTYLAWTHTHPVVPGRRRWTKSSGESWNQKKRKKVKRKRSIPAVKAQSPVVVDTVCAYLCILVIVDRSRERRKARRLPKTSRLG